MPVRRRRRIAAYGLCRDGGRVLLVRASDKADFPGVWQLPGGGVGTASTRRAVVRESVEETGLTVAVDRPVRRRPSEVRRLGLDVAVHTDRLIFDVTVVGGTLRDEAAGTSDDGRVADRATSWPRCR